jgi:hypothetical protein
MADSYFILFNKILKMDTQNMKVLLFIMIEKNFVDIIIIYIFDYFFILLN